MHLRLKIVLTILSVVAVLHLLVWQRRRFPRPIEAALDRLRIWWKGVTKKIAHGQTVVILFLVYYTGIALTAIFARLMRRDFLRIRKPSPAWLPRKEKKDTLETLKRQF